MFDRLRYGDRIEHHAILLAFDVLEIDGEDYRDRPIEVRKRALAGLTANAPPGLQLVEHLQGDGATIFEHACKLGCEGIVSKRIGSRYRPGPRKSDDWIKVKNPAAPAVKREAEKDWGKNRR
jgi:bifunctional non-homologous end joining protein LigD